MTDPNKAFMVSELVTIFQQQNQMIDDVVKGTNPDDDRIATAFWAMKQIAEQAVINHLQLRVLTKSIALVMDESMPDLAEELRHSIKDEGVEAFAKMFQLDPLDTYQLESPHLAEPEGSS